MYGNVEVVSDLNACLDRSEHMAVVEASNTKDMKMW